MIHTHYFKMQDIQKVQRKKSTNHWKSHQSEMIPVNIL